MKIVFDEFIGFDVSAFGPAEDLIQLLLKHFKATALSLKKKNQSALSAYIQ